MLELPSPHAQNPPKLTNVHCKLESRRCVHCGARVTGKPKGGLPGSKFANSLLAQLAVAHYLDNLTFGFLERHLGVGKSAVIHALQRMTKLLEPLHPLIIDEIREAAVALELFGDERLFGVMLTDRYSGYNIVKIIRQFCFEHLKRDVKKVAKDNPKSKEAALKRILDEIARNPQVDVRTLLPPAKPTVVEAQPAA